MPLKPLTAIIYADGEAADRALCHLAAHLRACGMRLAGLVQHNQPRANRRRCSMALENLSTGAIIPISEDRGAEARGCMLDVGQLLNAIEVVRAGLATAPALVILNKFGKTESEGRGFCPLIGEVMEAGIPMLIAVPQRNLDAFRDFAGDLATEFALETLPEAPEALAAVLGLTSRP